MKRNFSLMTLEDPKSPVAEAFRTLRTNIQFANVDSVIKSILFTSAGPGEGKSLIVANLAVAMAQAGKRVLIIDADLRNPTQYHLFNLNRNSGLSNSLSDSDEAFDYIQKTSMENIDVLTSGPIPPNPAEMLGSQRMKRILLDAEQAYDMVLIDTPPVIAVADASNLAQDTDGVILVMGSGEVNREFARYAKDQLEKVGANIIGVVLNKFELDAHFHRYYYYEKHKKRRFRRHSAQKVASM